MFPIKKQTFVIFLTFLLLVLSIPPLTFAQSDANDDANTRGAGTLGVARMMEVKEKNIRDGSIITSSEKGPVFSTLPYDPQILGIVARDAAILLSNSSSDTATPVISNGQVYILVSTKDGPIKEGDLLTSSTIPGVATRAEKDGYVLGRALEDYNNPDPKKIEKITVDLDLHYFNSKPTIPGSLTDIFKLALLPTKEGPSPIFKYIVAAIVVIASFVLAFLTFSRTAAKGVEALGRNPAASKIIHLGIMFNMAIVVVIVLAGMTISFLILRL